MVAIQMFDTTCLIVIPLPHTHTHTPHLAHTHTHIQGVYALIVYFFVSWHTLTRKHKKFVLGDEVEPLSVPEEPDYLASMNNLSTSRHKMDPQVIVM